MRMRKGFFPFMVIVVAGWSQLFAARGYIVEHNDGMGGDKASMKLLLLQNDFAYANGSGPSGAFKIHYGFSAGGDQTFGAIASDPSHSICATPIGDNCSSHAKESGYDVPLFKITGQQEGSSHSDCEQTIAAATSAGGLWAYAPNWGLQHAIGRSWDLVLPYWQELIRLRFPPGAKSLKSIAARDGWLADMSTWETDCPYIAPYNEYKGDRSHMSWLPNRYTAFLWRAFAVGKGTAIANPITLSKPAPLSGGGLGEYPEYKSGEMVPIQGVTSVQGIAKVGAYYGDNLIKEMPGAVYGIYSCTWKAVPGIHPIIMVAYDSAGTAIATSRPRVIQVPGALQPVKTVRSIELARERKGAPGQSFILPNGSNPVLMQLNGRSYRFAGLSDRVAGSGASAAHIKHLYTK